MIKEFKEFISKGNVVEMAVGLIMATYFGAIIKSLVNDIIMPPIGQLLGGVDFAELKVVIQEGAAAVMNGETVVTPEVKEVAITYGNFINTILVFVIVAFSIFIAVKQYNGMKRRMEAKAAAEAEAAPAAPPEPSNEEKLLTEIRDLLKR
ncbi:MAG: large-conductance mechanosensitive channel protein MscL [Bacteroidota bacterium]